MLKDYKGACHIHTEYSDGSIPVSDVIKSAQDADLDFVILSDHNTFLPKRTDEPKKSKPRWRPFPKGYKYASLRKKQPDKKKAGLESYIQRKTSDGKKIADFILV